MFDYLLGRITVLTEDGRMGRLVQLAPEAVRATRLAGVTDDGGFLFTTDVFDDRRTGIHQGTHPYIFVDDGGNVRDTVGLFPGTEFYVVEVDGRRATGRRPFSTETYASARFGTVAVSTGEAFEFELYSGSGDLQRIVRVPMVREEVTAAQVREWRREAAGGRSRGTAGQWRERVWNEIGVPEKWPSFRRVLVSESQHVWLEHFPRTDYLPLSPDRPGTWLVFAADGTYLQKVNSPPGVRIGHIGEDIIVGTSRDRWGVERVEVYEMRSPSAEPVDS